MYIENKDGEAILNIRVIPNAPFNCIKEISGDRLKIKIKAVPEDKRANMELINYLAETFNTKKNNIEIIKGLKSREKTIKIKGVNYNIILQKIKEALL